MAWTIFFGDRISLRAAVGVCTCTDRSLKSEKKQQSKQVWSSGRWSQAAAGTFEPFSPCLGHHLLWPGRKGLGEEEAACREIGRGASHCHP